MKKYFLKIKKFKDDNRFAMIFILPYLTVASFFWPEASHNDWGDPLTALYHILAVGFIVIIFAMFSYFIAWLIILISKKKNIVSKEKTILDIASSVSIVITFIFFLYYKHW